MGIPYPLLGIPVGVPCECHPEPDDTPAVIYVLFDGLQPCPGKLTPPNGHIFTCQQDEISPCKWVDDSTLNPWTVELNYLCIQNQTQIQLTDDVPSNYYLGLVNGFAPEHTIFDNVYGGCALNQNSFNGVATLFWLDAAIQLVADLVLPIDGGLFIEFFLKDENTPVYKFCNVKYGLNQTIQLP